MPKPDGQMKSLALLITLSLLSTIASAQTVADPQRQATDKYPALAQEGSPLHTRFLALYNDTKQNNPMLLIDPTGPSFSRTALLSAALTAEQLLRQAETSLRSGEFASVADALNRIAADYATSPQSKTVHVLRDFVRPKAEKHDVLFTSSEAQKIRSSMDAFDSYQNRVPNSVVRT
jgi:hypothetical protein